QLRVKRAKRRLRTSNRAIGAAATHSIKIESPILVRIPNRISIGDRISNSLLSFWSAERQRSATRVLGAGRAQARNVTSIRVGCSAWFGPVRQPITKNAAPQRVRRWTVTGNESFKFTASNHRVLLNRAPTPDSS